MIRQYKDKARREVLRKIGVFASVGAIFIITPGCGTIAPEVSGTSVQTCAPASSLNITTAKFVRFKTQSSCGFDLMHIALESPDDLSGGAVSVNGIEFDYDTRGLEEPGWYWFNSDAISSFAIDKTYTIQVNDRSICATLEVGQC